MALLSQGINRLEDVKSAPRKGCKEGSQVWSAKRDTPGLRRLTSLRTLKACEETPRSPSGCAAWQERTRGCARFTRLTPGYSPCTPPGC